MDVYGYFRILHVNEQTEEDRQKLLDEGIESKKIYADYFAPKTVERTAFEQMKALLEPGDIVVIPRMLYLGNSVLDILEQIEEFSQIGATLHLLDVGILDDMPAAQMVVRTLKSIDVVEHTRGLESRAYRQKTDPRSKLEQSRVLRRLEKNGLKEQVVAILQENKNLSKAARILGVSRGTIYRWQEVLLETGDLVPEEKKETKK